MAEPRPSYDAFLCHSGSDKPQVRELAGLLRAQSIRVFLDEDTLVPGQPWQEQLEAAIKNSNAGLILYGPSGLGPWAVREMRAFIDAFVRRGAAVIPVVLPGAPAIPELPLFLRQFQWVDLRGGFGAGIDRLLLGIRSAPLPSPSTPAHGSNQAASAPSTPLFRLWNVPPLPDSYQPRSEVEALRRALLSSSADPLAVTGQHTRFAVEGMGGVGKTVLATALARDPDVRRAFPGGVYWLPFGQTPEPTVILQGRLASAVLGRVVTPTTSREGEQLLRDAFSTRACLVILDDVWEGAHAAPFNVMGDLGKLLVTTRKHEVALGLGAEFERLEELASEQAITLLARYANLLPEALPPEAPELVRQCGELPLALAVVGSMLRGKPVDRWRLALERLRRGALPEPGHPPPQYSHRSTAAALEASVDDLPADMKPRYLDLAVFPEDVAIPEAALRTYWAPLGDDEQKVAALVDEFVDRSLLRRDSEGRVELHDLQHDHVRAVAGDLTPLHRRLVGAYRRAGADGGLHLVPSDGYFFEHAAVHVRAAEGAESLRRLLLDYRWLAAKLKATSINALLSDFELLDLASEQPLRLLRDALRLSAHVLAHRPEELSSQLLARLRGFSEPPLSQLCADLEASGPRLCPLWPSLAPPGGSLLGTLEGHGGWVMAVALSGDGKVAVSGSGDRTLKVWDVASGKALRILEGHGAWVNAVVLSGDGKTAVSGSSDKTLKVWDVTSGKEFRSLEGHGGRVNAVALSWDGKTAISGSSDKTLKVWDLASGEELRSLEGHGGEVRAVALSGDGKTVISGSVDNTLKVWDVASGKELRTFEGHGGGVRAVALSGDGKIAVSGSGDRTLKVWDVASGKELCTFEGHGGGVMAVALDVDGKTAVSSSEGDTLKVWHVASGKELRTLEGHGAWVSAVALSVDGKTAISGSLDRTLKVWDVASGKKLRTLEGHGARVSAVALSEDGTIAVSGSLDRTLKVWDVASGKELRTLEGHSRSVTAVALSEDGKTAVSGSGDWMLKVWDVASGKEMCTFEGHCLRVRAVALSRDGKTAVSGSDDKTFRVWDVATGEALRTFEGHHDSVRAVALSADGKIAVSGSDETLRVWDVASGEALCTIEGRSRGMWAVALSGDGRTAVSGSADKTLKVWDVASGKVLRILEGHGGPVNAVALSMDGKTAVSGSEDTTLKVWDMATGECIATFSAEAPLYGVALQASRVCAGDNAGHLHLFALRIDS